MRRSFRRSSLVVALFFGCSGFAARAQDRIVDLKDVPENVRQAAEKAVAAKWTAAVSRAEADHTTYRVKGADFNGCKVEATLSADGKVERLETSFTAAQIPLLPAEVLAAARSGSPGAKWTEAVQTTDDGGLRYLLSGQSAKGLAIELTLTVEIKVTQIETVLKLDDLPSALARVTSRVPGAKWRRAVERSDEETSSFEANGTDAKGREVSVTVSDAGESVVRTELNPFEIPTSVIDSLKAKLPTFTPKSVALVDQEGSASYEFAGVGQAGDEMTVKSSLDGKTISVVEEEEDDD